MKSKRKKRTRVAPQPSTEHIVSEPPVIRTVIRKPHPSTYPPTSSLQSNFSVGPQANHGFYNDAQGDTSFTNNPQMASTFSTGPQASNFGDQPLNSNRLPPLHNTGDASLTSNRHLDTYIPPHSMSQANSSFINAPHTIGTGLQPNIGAQSTREVIPTAPSAE